MMRRIKRSCCTLLVLAGLLLGCAVARAQEAENSRITIESSGTESAAKSPGASAVRKSTAQAGKAARVAWLREMAESGTGDDNARVAEFLKDGDADLRADAISALAGMNGAARFDWRHGQSSDPEFAEEALAHALEDAAPQVRAAAAEGLGQLSMPEAQEPLRVALRDANSSVVLAAVRALREGADEPSVAALSAVYWNAKSSPALKTEVVGALAESCAPGSVPVLTNALAAGGKHPNEEVAHGLQCALAQHADGSAFPAIAKAVRAQGPLPSQELLIALGETRNPQAFTALTDVYHFVDATRKIWVVEALGELHDNRAAPIFQELLRSEQVVMRRAAAKGLAGLHGVEPSIELLGAVNDPDEAVRQYAAYALMRSQHGGLAAAADKPF